MHQSLLATTVLLAGAVSPETKAFVEAIIAGAEQWHREVEFSCTFAAREGYARTFEDGVAGHFDDSIEPESEFVARSTGWHGKLGRQIRYREMYDERSLGGRNTSTDNVTDGRITLLYHPQQKPSLECIAFFKLRADIGERALRGRAGEWVTTRLSPLIIDWCQASDLFHVPVSEGEMILSPHLEVRDLNESQIEVVSIWDTSIFKKKSDRPIISYRQTYVIRTDLQPPTIVRRETESDTGGSVLIRDDFVRCMGGDVPRIVRSVMQRDDGTALLNEWRSEDLGERAATAADFTLKVPPHTYLSNLKRLPPVVDGQRILDLQNLAIADIGVPETPLPIPRPTHPSSGSVSARADRREKLIIAANVLLVVGVSIVYLRRIAHRRTTESRHSP